MSTWIPKKESDMSSAIVAYLKHRGFEVYGEVPDKKGVIDHVGKKGGVLVAVEMKLLCNLHLLFQTFKNTWFCNYSYLVFPFKGQYVVPRSPELARIKYLCEALGLGILKYGPESLTNENFKYNNVYISEWLKPKRVVKPKWKSVILQNLTPDLIDKIGGVSYTKKAKSKRRKIKRK